MIKYILILFLICSCATIEEPDEKWKIAAEYLPREKLQGLVHAGFFEINDSIYSHGNMIRMKYDDGGKLWKQVKYETLGCGQ